MVINLTDSTVQKKLEAEVAAHALVKHVLDALTAAPTEFRVYPEASGFEFGATNEVKGAPNRGLMKIFFPAGQKLVGIFYKKSSVPYSRDRYSYGGVQVTEANIASAGIPEWLDYLASGFHPDKRPAKLQRTLPYTLPEN